MFLIGLLILAVVVIVLLAIIALLLLRIADLLERPRHAAFPFYTDMKIQEQDIP